MKRILLATLLSAALVLPAAAFAQSADPALDARLKKLEEELRCLVCQNQSLADSSAPLAEDLRREVRGLAQQGKNDEQIKEYLVARYGDFVLYNPPVKGTTWLLWFGPFALLLGGGAIWALVLKRRGRAGYDDDETPAPDAKAVAAGVEKARELLDDPRA